MLSVTSLKKTYRTKAEAVVAIDGVSFNVSDGEFFSILGPSGCGKTTVLRAIAGLERPDAGEIVIGGRQVFSAASNVNIPPQKRDMSLMFQSYAIWPHMSVYENVAFPLRARRAERIDERVTAALATVALGETANRLASQLSGGQQQRLALARAIISHPRVLLLDEPLSNLDVKLREQLRVELKRVQREVGVTTIYVTHDQAEALSLSDRLAVMDKGRFLQVGPPREIYRQPTSRAVAQFIGQSNSIPAAELARDASAYRQFDTPFGRLEGASGTAGAEGQGVTLTVRPECLRLVAPGGSGPNLIEGRVALTMFYGDHQDIQVAVSGRSLLIRTVGGVDVAVGDVVRFSIDPADIVASRSGTEGHG